MDRYLVVSPHTAEECQKAIERLEAIGYITHFDWGCKDGEHCGWAIIEADSKSEALLVVPALERSHARAIKLVKFSPKDVKPTHPQ
jgi:hypothetical protein